MNQPDYDDSQYQEFKDWEQEQEHQASEDAKAIADLDAEEGGIMGTKETLWHIDWGDGDTCFVIAPDEETARERMPEGQDMVNYVVRLDGLYEKIFKAGYGKRDSEFVYNPDYLDFQKGVKEGRTIGKKAGIREVVEWGDEICMEHGERKRRKCDKCWQAQRKVWEGLR